MSLIQLRSFDRKTSSIVLTDQVAQPWDGLGHNRVGSETLESMMHAAKLDFTVNRATVNFDVPTIKGISDIENVRHQMKDRVVLYRSDTFAPLSVVSTNGYKVVQPSDIGDTFNRIAEAAKLEIDIVGSVNGGRRIWALARCGDGFAPTLGDTVFPYLLFATSYDGSLSTTVSFTTLRRACNNMLAPAIGQISKMAAQGIKTAVKIPHSTKFDLDKVVKELDEITGGFGVFQEQAKRLADREVSYPQAEALIAKILSRGKATEPKEAEEIKGTKGFKRVMNLFDGAAMGSEHAGDKSLWALLNSVTQHVDHERGRNRDSGLSSAWFGEGARIKQEALSTLLEATEV